MKKEFKMVPLSQIRPDEQQPRRNFDIHRLNQLKASIETQGIQIPLSVQQLPDGTYLLEDGERRFRAATQLGLEEVPALVSEQTNDTERLVNQFHLQEQHQGWSHTEKALAVGQLAEQLGMSTADTGRMLSIPEATIRMYRSLWSLMERDTFIRAELSLKSANLIKRVKTRASKIYKQAFGKEMTDELTQSLELRLISDLKEGKLEKSRDIIKLGDTFAARPDYIKVYVDSNIDIDSAFEASNAKSIQNARQLSQMLPLVEGRVNWLNENQGEEFFAEGTSERTNLVRIARKLSRFAERISNS